MTSAQRGVAAPPVGAGEPAGTSPAAGPRHDTRPFSLLPLLFRLKTVHRRARRVDLASGLSAWVCVVLSTCALTLAADLALDLSAMGRFLAAAAVLTATCLGLAMGVGRVVLKRMDPEALALRVEGHFGGLHSLLISALQLSVSDGRRATNDERRTTEEERRKKKPGVPPLSPHASLGARHSTLDTRQEVSAAMIEMVGRQAVERVSGMHLASVVPTRGLRRRFLSAAGALLVAGAYTAARPEVVRAWAGRLVHPFDPGRVYPTQTHLTALSGDMAVRQGDFAVLAALATGRVPEAGALHYWQSGGLTGRLAVKADTAAGARMPAAPGHAEESASSDADRSGRATAAPENAVLRHGVDRAEGAAPTSRAAEGGPADGRTFRLRLGPINEDTWYRFEVGDARTPRHLVVALPRPRLTDLVLNPRLPPYVRLPDPPPDRLREVQALMGTEIHLQGWTHVPESPRLGTRQPLRVTRAALLLASGPVLPMRVAPDGTIAGRFLVAQDDAYQILLEYDYHAARPPSGVGVFAAGGGGATAGPASAPAAVTVASDRPIWYRVSALPDAPPAIKIVEPGPTADASPAGQVTLKLEITDDYAVESAHLWYAVRRPAPARPTGEPQTSASGESVAAPGPPDAVASVSAPEDDAGAVDRRAFTRVDLTGRFGSRRVTIDYDWLISRTGALAGDRILYYVSATDGRQVPARSAAEAAQGAPDAGTLWRDEPNLSESEMYEIAVLSMEEIERQLRERRESIWEEIYRVYQRERDLRRDVDDLRSPAPATQPATRPAEGTTNDD